MNTLSRKFIEALVGRFPELPAKLDSATSQDGTFTVEIPSPTGNSHPLRLSTEDDELTIGFDCFHSHYGGWQGTKEDESVQSAMEVVNDILDEKLVSISIWQGERYKGSWMDAPGEPVTSSQYIQIEPGDTIRIRSWKGNYDCDTSVETG